ncbi:hypothetical protein N9L06_05820 [Mariniblastus sp.]|nr:hypothetical protein [Mariniblastus sp.]
MRNSTVFMFFVFAFFLTATATADLISSSISGSVDATFRGTTNSDSSTANSNVLVVTASGNNSSTVTNLGWMLSGDTLTGTTLITESKALNQGRGGQHVGASDFVFNFEVDSPTDFVLDGTWGFNTATGTDDSLAYTFTGPGGFSISDASTGTTGIMSDSFLQSGTLAPGAYTLTFTADLVETFNNQDMAQAGWTINEFTLTAIPEPAMSLVLMFMAGGSGARRYRL